MPRYTGSAGTDSARVAPGRRRKYQLGGAFLACHAGAPVVPVAHNAGRYWPRNSFLKYPGTVTVRIGAPLDVWVLHMDGMSDEAVRIARGAG